MIRTNKKKKIKGQTQKFQSILDKNTPFAYVEAFNTLRTNMEFVCSANGAQCILVTSAQPAECKSTVALNLAFSMSESGYSVVVVECDMRKPSLTKHLKFEKMKYGLSTFLSGKVDLNDCIVELEKTNVSIIFSGMIPPNPSELLNQVRMEALIQALKKRYDYVILDAPPVTVVTDAMVVGRMADGALLVVRSKYVQTNTIRLAKQRLESVGIKLWGAVLTRFDFRNASWYSGYSYKNYVYGYGEYIGKE